MMVTKIRIWFGAPVSIAPLANFRVLFGVMMFLSTIRFWLKGWITMQYVDPAFHFTFMGFDWVRPCDSYGMHLVFLLIGISALLVAIGLWYRLAIVTFFLLFTYVELIDVTYYLNHYYFISVISFLLIWLPAGRFFSVDVLLRPVVRVTVVPRWVLGIIRLQLGIVYFYAGLAKLNADWMLEALPMKIWLPVKSHLPVVGQWMYKEWVAYFFSWFGAAYDLLIVFFLLHRRTRPLAYLIVLVFHAATAIFFPAIGMFPYIMIVSSLIYFSGDFHLKAISFVAGRVDFVGNSWSPKGENALRLALGVFFFIQIVFPFRYLAYPGPLFWTEQGYRFSWRVMLMEKVGTANFYVRENGSERSYEVNNNEFLTTQQQKMMSTQPDMILRYAHFLARVYKDRGLIAPQVFAETYVTLNGRRSIPFINPRINLAGESLSFKNYKWILPFQPIP